MKLKELVEWIKKSETEQEKDKLIEEYWDTSPRIRFIFWVIFTLIICAIIGLCIWVIIKIIMWMVI